MASRYLNKKDFEIIVTNCSLLITFVGECVDLKNMRGVNNVKSDIKNVILIPSFGAEILSRMGR